MLTRHGDTLTTLTLDMTVSYLPLYATFGGVDTIVLPWLTALTIIDTSRM